MADPSQFTVIANRQPYFKLHGSIDFIDERKMLLILGDIERNALLNWYQQEFIRRVCSGDARIMVVGYSFGDAHINRILTQGARTGAKLFIIDPSGVDVLITNAKDLSGADYRAIRTNIIGASRRALAEFFGNGPVIEFNKLSRFFGYSLADRTPWS